MVEFFVFIVIQNNGEDGGAAVVQGYCMGATAVDEGEDFSGGGDWAVRAGGAQTSR